MSIEKDCFNGQTTVGTKYNRLEIDYDAAYAENERDLGYDSAEAGNVSQRTYWDPDYIDPEGADIFERVGQTFLSGDGLVTGLYRTIIAPVLRGSRKLIRRYNLAGLL